MIKFIDPSLDEKHPIRVFFEERGYAYQKSCSIHSDQFSKNVLYHNGVKYYLLWRREDWKHEIYGSQENWYCLMITSFVRIEFLRHSLLSVEEVEQRCKEIYDKLSLTPVETYESR